ncbi:MAG: hypothetical protein PHV30_04815, partial [Candidatus Margulisbacteria bacterium]|nr:hypothetical protein [Candidatus Margulisiibacteriota bacterium]
CSSDLATDIQTADSGLATWNISFSKEDNSFNSNISGNLDSSQDAVVLFDLSGASGLSPGSYVLHIEFLDMIGNIVTASYQLTLPESSAGYNFMLGPNPVNINKSDVHITYELKEPADIQIKVYNVGGQLEKDFSYTSGDSGGQQGLNHILWNGFNNNNKKLSTGLYFVYQIINNDKAKINKFLLLVVK